MNTGYNRRQIPTELDDSESSPADSGDSPRSAVSTDTKIASTSSPKKGRRAIQKRVVSVPIKDVEGFRLKADQMNTAPPCDSWAWRKYGQKPIKGSPYPRGYYRCSSSKGCPARKQVERSRVDPKTLVVTYYCEHNHNWPASKSNRHKTTSSAARNVKMEEEDDDEQEDEEEEEEEEQEEKPRNIPSKKSHEEDNYSCSLVEAPPLIHNAEFGWFADFDPTSFTMLESPMLTEDRISTDSEMAMIFTMREEDESLFADLGELPECSTVFRRGMVETEAEQRRPGLATTS